jgi:hypothetical protein
MVKVLVALVACGANTTDSGHTGMDDGASMPIAAVDHVRVDLQSNDESNSLAGVDADGDGSTDLVATAAVRYDDSTWGHVVTLFLGPFGAGADVPRTAGASLVTMTSLGMVAAAGDLDGDGSVDLIATDHGYGAYILRGPFASDEEAADVSTLQWPDKNWWTLGGVGDVDHDGLDDVVVCDASSSGPNTLSFVPGPARVTQAELDPTWTTGWSDPAYVGCQDVASRIGDLTGDGRDDIVVAAYAEETGYEVKILAEVPVGTATLYESGVHLVADPGTVIGAVQQMQSAADANEDGYVDLAVTSLGAVGVFYGPCPDSGAQSFNDADAVVVYGEAARFESRGDVDGDGSPDYAISSLYEGEPLCEGKHSLAASLGCAVGAVGTLSGPLMPGVYTPTATYWGDDEWSELGNSMVGDVDFDGDGVKDLVVRNWTEAIIMFGI